MKCAVFDTNVLVSAFLFGGKPRECLQGALSGRVTLAISREILNETLEVLARPRFGLPADLIQAFAHELLQISRLVTPTRTIQRIKRDPDDNRILECAVAADADCIVSGDSDLLEIKDYAGIQILTVAEFLDALAAE